MSVASRPSLAPTARPRVSATSAGWLRCLHRAPRSAPRRRVPWTPGCHRSHTAFRDELYMHSRTGIGVLQVVDQLRQIFDRIDVVVRRRRDQPDARRRVAHLGDPRIHLVARKLAALTGFGTLSHLDLDISTVRQVVAGDTEAARRDLLDALRRQSPFSSRSKRSTLSPPSPELDRPPRRFIAMASVS